MGKSESRKKYNEEMKRQGRVSRSYWIDKNAPDALDNISKTSQNHKNDLVSKAIIEYANKNYGLDLKEEPTKRLSLGELSQEVSLLASKMERFSKVYFYATLKEEGCDAIIKYLKALREKGKKYKTREVFGDLNSKMPAKLSSYLEYQYFVDTFKDEIYSNDETPKDT